jgi:hypothetical protein
MSRSGSATPTARDHQIRQMISKGLEKASYTSLTMDEVITLTELIHKNPETALETLEPSIQSFAGTIEFNASLFRETILPLLISSPLREEYYLGYGRKTNLERSRHSRFYRLCCRCWKRFRCFYLLNQPCYRINLRRVRDWFMSSWLMRDDNWKLFRRRREGKINPHDKFKWYSEYLL